MKLIDYDWNGLVFRNLKSRSLYPIMVQKVCAISYIKVMGMAKLALWYYFIIILIYDVEWFCCTEQHRAKHWIASKFYCIILLKNECDLGSSNSIFYLDNLFCRYLTPLLFDKIHAARVKSTEESGIRNCWSKKLDCESLL